VVENKIIIGNKPVGTYYRSIVNSLTKSATIYITFTKKDYVASKQTDMEMLDKLRDVVKDNFKDTDQEKALELINEIRYGFLLSNEEKAREIVQNLEGIGIHSVKEKEVAHNYNGKKYMNIQIRVDLDPSIIAAKKREKEYVK